MLLVWQRNGHTWHFEATIDATVEHVTITKILKAYGDSGFGGSTGSNFKGLEAQILTKEKVSSKMVTNNYDAVNIDFSQQQQQKHNDEIDSNDGCSLPLKPEKGSLIKQKRKRLTDIQSQ